MDLFTLEPDSDKLTHLHIIYDTPVLPVIYISGLCAQIALCRCKPNLWRHRSGGIFGCG